MQLWVPASLDNEAGFTRKGPGPGTPQQDAINIMWWSTEMKVCIFIHFLKGFNKVAMHYAKYFALQASWWCLCYEERYPQQSQNKQTTHNSVHQLHAHGYMTANVRIKKWVKIFVQTDRGFASPPYIFDAAVVIGHDNCTESDTTGRALLLGPSCSQIKTLNQIDVCCMR